MEKRSVSCGLWLAWPSLNGLVYDKLGRQPCRILTLDGTAPVLIVAGCYLKCSTVFGLGGGGARQGHQEHDTYLWLFGNSSDTSHRRQKATAAASTIQFWVFQRAMNPHFGKWILQRSQILVSVTLAKYRKGCACTLLWRWKTLRWFQYPKGNGVCFRDAGMHIVVNATELTSLGDAPTPSHQHCGIWLAQPPFGIW